MIQPEELRIGNLIHIPKTKQEAKISLITQKFDDNAFIGVNKDIIGITGLTLKDIEPIPLTEEWLTSFRFIKFRKLQFRKCISLACDLEVAFLKSKIIVAIVKHEQERNQVFKLRYIKYVHELQNLFYDITDGEELTIKE